MHLNEYEHDSAHVQRHIQCGAVVVRNAQKHEECVVHQPDDTEYWTTQLWGLYNKFSENIIMLQISIWSPWLWGVFLSICLRTFRYVKNLVATFSWWNFERFNFIPMHPSLKNKLPADGPLWETLLTVAAADDTSDETSVFSPIAANAILRLRHGRVTKRCNSRENTGQIKTPRRISRVVSFVFDQNG